MAWVMTCAGHPVQHSQSTFGQHDSETFGHGYAHGCRPFMFLVASVKYHSKMALETKGKKFPPNNHRATARRNYVLQRKG